MPHMGYKIEPIDLPSNRAGNPMSAVAVVVAIVSYQCADLTIDCLRSVDAERSTVDVHIRAIVVDNASGDASLISQAIEAHGWSSWITLIIAPRNGGFAYGNNLAFQRAYEDHPPDYLLMLNPDTVVRKGAIGALVRFLEAHPGVGIAGSSFENLDGSEWPMAFRFPSILGELEHGLQFGLATRVFRPWVGAVQMSQVPQSDRLGAGCINDDSPNGSRLDWWLRRKLFPVFRRDRLLLSREESRFFDLVCSTEPRHAYCRTEHKAHRAQCSSQDGYRPIGSKSRRRYFAATHGIRYAMATDAVALMAHGLGSLKRIAQRRAGCGVPHFLADLAQHSILWPRNRKLAAIKHFVPRS